jgi:hypothetical protein
MDLQKMKLLAGRVRGLLEQSQHSIGHNQSLDLIAALAGLRNWPEVQAFPDRVAGCELDAASAGRLAFRLKKQFGLDISPLSMLAALIPPGKEKPVRAPQIWPTGPAPGVYITDSQEAINALLDRYEEATDGALVYAEKAASHWDGSIDLGDGGLWSNGLQRVPSGTLVVVGPLELNQQAWDNSAEHLEMACLVAQGSEHRVAVLISTPTPEAMFEDVHLMVRSAQPAGDDCERALVGSVSAEGELQPRAPFATDRPPLTALRSVATAEAIPVSARETLKGAIGDRASGLLLFGSSVIEEHRAVDLVSASLALTEHAGPAARIMPRDRSTPAKDWQVPEAIAQLPFLPSIQSAYEQGYRRMYFSPTYTPSELLMEFSEDVLLISGTYGSDVDEIFLSTLRAGGLRNEGDLLDRVIAILGVKKVPGEAGELAACDLYVRSQRNGPIPQELEEALEFLQSHRTIMWEDELTALLRSGAVSAAGVKKALPRARGVAEFLAQGRKDKAAKQRNTVQ